MASQPGEVVAGDGGERGGILPGPESYTTNTYIDLLLYNTAVQIPADDHHFGVKGRRLRLARK